MMLQHLGLNEAAETLEKALARVYRDGKKLTQDQGGSATTTEFGRAVMERLE